MSQFRFILLLTFAFALTGFATAQNTIQAFTSDSVELEQVVKRVIETHPSVLKAEEATNAAMAGIGLAKSAWYPDIDLGAGYTRIGPVPSITIPNMGTFQMAPPNNFNTSVNIHQTVYDFSKTERSVKVAESGRDIVEKNVELVQQRLSLLTILNYYNLAYLQEAVQIKTSQLNILEKHLEFIQKKKETGSATDYEILATKVRISSAKNQKLDLETSLDNQLSILNSMLGLPESTHIKVKNRLMVQSIPANADSLMNYALDHRNELVLAGLREKQAELKLQSLKIENNPVLSAFVSGGIKNGYFPDMNVIKANYAAGLGLRVPIYTATKHRNLIQIASSDINSVRQDMEQNRREISSEVYQNAANLKSSGRKIEQSVLQLEQAEEARKLADLSFKAGTLTNLDLLDSESLEAESRLNLIRARTDYMINVAKLEISVGNKAY